jgi:hypothetical protein
MKTSKKITNKKYNRKSSTRKSNIKLNRKTKTKKRGAYKKIQKGGAPIKPSENPLSKKEIKDIGLVASAELYENCDRFDLKVDSIELDSNDETGYIELGYKLHTKGRRGGSYNLVVSISISDTHKTENEVTEKKYYFMEPDFPQTDKGGTVYYCLIDPENYRGDITVIALDGLVTNKTNITDEELNTVKKTIRDDYDLVKNSDKSASDFLDQLKQKGIILFELSEGLLPYASIRERKKIRELEEQIRTLKSGNSYAPTFSQTYVV